jgi:hypothetical protein
MELAASIFSLQLFDDVTTIGVRALIHKVLSISQFGISASLM